MPKFSLDYNQIADTIHKRKYALEDVKDKIVKVAFDIVRFKDSDLNHLWQIHHTNDGDYITALYEEEDGALKKAEEKKWEVEVNKTANVIHVFYKKEPVCSLTSRDLGISESEITKTASFLPNSLEENKKLAKLVLSKLGKNVHSFVRKYPELA